MSRDIPDKACGYGGLFFFLFAAFISGENLMSIKFYWVACGTTLLARNTLWQCGQGRASSSNSAIAV